MPWGRFFCHVFEVKSLIFPKLPELFSGFGAVDPSIETKETSLWH